ncbi:MAG TPA: HAMP domain-containing sensor histidine kinase, partial [Terriglobales bacterium]
HEIQNPLDSVMNLLYLIENSPDTTGSSLGYARTAQEELQRITQITRQLLSFNREAREPISIDVAEIIDSVQALLAAKMTASGIELIRDYRTHRHVFGLPGELRQVFSNLIVNAMEASAPGGRIVVRVQEMTERLAPGRPGIQVTVSDTGKGISASDRSDLFTPFFTTKGERGTGLGLWVSRGIIAKHQGHMRFRSCTIGAHRGTTFSVFLPLEQAAETPVQTAA